MSRPLPASGRTRTVSTPAVGAKWTMKTLREPKAAGGRLVTLFVCTIDGRQVGGVEWDRRSGEVTAWSSVGGSVRGAWASRALRLSIDRRLRSAKAIVEDNGACQVARERCDHREIALDILGARRWVSR